MGLKQTVVSGIKLSVIQRKLCVAGNVNDIFKKLATTDM
jgi:hypothetical protein